MSLALAHTDFDLPAPQLRQLCLLTDGNAHRTDLVQAACNDRHFDHADKIHECLLPEIRITAMLIASQRHDWTQNSPAVFADEADWFAARLLLLNVRHVHLHADLTPMLRLANQRAQAFAQKHGLPFTPARIRPCLHHHRPAAVLLLDCELAGCLHPDAYQNSRQIRELLVKTM